MAKTESEAATLPLRECRTLEAFVQAARRFVQLTKASATKGPNYPEELYRAVLGLANTTFSLVLSDLGTDDVADIYRDLKPALDAWDMQKDEYLADIICCNTSGSQSGFGAMPLFLLTALSWARMR
ncbi:MAG: hypothetical protein JKY56_16840 [Kofleriaceae bacterium]|nr:hypothetical protein [Kofleriaceae bacterium]